MLGRDGSGAGDAAAALLICRPRTRRQRRDARYQTDAFGRDAVQSEADAEQGEEVKIDADAEG